MSSERALAFEMFAAIPNTFLANQTFVEVPARVEVIAVPLDDLRYVARASSDRLG